MLIKDSDGYWAIAEQPDVLVVAAGDDVMTRNVLEALDNVADKFRLTVVLSGGRPSAGASKVVAKWHGTTMTLDGSVVLAEPGSCPPGILRALVEETVPGGRLEAIAFERVDDKGLVMALIGDHPNAVAELRQLDSEDTLLAACRIAVAEGDENEGGAGVIVEGATDLADFLTELSGDIAELEE
jgi:hypothetical protein